MSLRRKIAAAGLAVAAVAGGTAAAAAAPGTGCARQFDAAVAAYVHTTDRRDARGFNALLHRDVTGVLPGGAVFGGKREMAGFIDRFFARTDWTQTSTRSAGRRTARPGTCCSSRCTPSRRPGSRRRW